MNLNDITIHFAHPAYQLSALFEARETHPDGDRQGDGEGDAHPHRLQIMAVLLQKGRDDPDDQSRFQAFAQAAGRVTAQGWIGLRSELTMGQPAGLAYVLVLWTGIV